MQSKISSFFKPDPLPGRKSSDSFPFSHELFASDSEKLTEEPDFTVTYKRKISNSLGKGKASKKHESDETLSKLKLSNCSQYLKKKKKINYAQLYLEVGQSDFLLQTCSACGLMYSTGEEGDEKVHLTFHSRVGVTRGLLIHLKMDVLSWCKMEILLLTKISCRTNRKGVHRIIPSNSMNEKYKNMSLKETISSTTPLQFGGISLDREIIRRDFINNPKEDGPAILCEDEARPAVCGIRAVWVTPFNRRKHIGSNLLDAARKSFCTGLVLDYTQLAFSPPTAQGNTLISNYTRTPAFLVYIASASTEQSWF